MMSKELESKFSEKIRFMHLTFYQNKIFFHVFVSCVGVEASLYLIAFLYRSMRVHYYLDRAIVSFRCIEGFGSRTLPYTTTIRKDVMYV